MRRFLQIGEVLGRALSLCTAALVLGRCAVGPNFTKPEVSVPAKFSAASDSQFATHTAVDSLWWKTFNDPALDRLVDIAYRQNLPLQVAGLRIVEARAVLGVATGKQFPQTQDITTEGRAVGLSADAPNIANFSRQFFTYELGFDALWELDFWGKYRRGVESASSNLLATVADYYNSVVSLASEVARTYVVIRTLEVLVELARENAGIQEEGLHISSARFTNGATSELDVTQATTLLEGTRATIPRLEAQLSQARNALSTLLGQPTGSVESLLAGPKKIPQPPLSVAVGVPAELLRRRPDIRSAELNAAAQCARIGVAKAELFPSFSLFGSVGLQASNVGTSPGLFFSPSNLFYSAGPRIVWPFLNYGRLENAVRVEDARFQQLLVGYRDTVLRALQEVEDASTGFLGAQRALTFEQASVVSAKRSVELALVQYREGAADYQRVLDAERSLLQQQNRVAETSQDVATTLIALYKALGGGWEFSQGQSVVTDQTQEQMKKRTDWGDIVSAPRKPEISQNPQPLKP